MRRFSQVDVFTNAPLRGNPVAVVLDGDGLSDDEMQRFANWTNLSETTFVCSPTHPDADYRLRIFTPAREMDFAGHPTIGSCHAWLEAGGVPKATAIVQECGVGNVTIRRDGRLAFAAPQPRQMRPLTPTELAATCTGARIDPALVIASQLLDNGPVFHTIVVDDAQTVLDCSPDLLAIGDLHVAVAGRYRAPAPGSPDLEVRMFAPGLGVAEDPVTGSLNAILAQWLIDVGLMPDRYLASQGTVLGRAGRVHISMDGGDVWVAGDAVTCIRGELTI
jgi:PhzF family phenazine biosynthesis protein